MEPETEMMEDGFLLYYPLKQGLKHAYIRPQKGFVNCFYSTIH